MTSQAGANASLAGSTFGAVWGAVGSYYAARSQRGQLEYAAQLAEDNVRMAEWQAKDATRRGERVEDASRIRFKQLRGKQEVALAANGVELGSGSALDMLLDTDYLSEIEAATIRENTGREANAYENQARQFRNDARFARAGKKGISPGMAATTTLIGGAGQVAGKWYGYKQAGVYGS